ncbi:MAG: APC family permease [Nocardioides sp.]|uniref:APC family permease n=1 Tax=Nocardioides sp. TaxID=35761 RepID=UPI0039E62233
MSTVKELPASDAPGDGPALAAAKISLGQALWYGFAALGLPACLGTAGAYTMGAGNAAWLGLTLAAAAIGVLSIIIVGFARKYLVSGSLMSYLRLELGNHAGRLGGAALTVGYAGAITSYLSTVLYFGMGALQGIGMPEIPLSVQIILAAVILAACSLLQRQGVSVSVNASIVLSFLVAPFVLLILGAVVINRGVDIVPQLQLKGFSMTTFVPTVVIGFGTFVAFEGLTALARETKNSQRTLPVVVNALVAALAVASLISIVITVPVLAQHSDQLMAGESPLHILAKVGGVPWAGFPADLLMAVSLGGALIAYINDSSRVVATASRDGYLPRVLGRIHPHHRTPALAGSVMSCVAFVLMATYLLLSNQGMYGVTLNFTSFMVYSWSVAYVAIAVAGIVAAVRFKRPAIIVPAIVVIAFLVAVAGYSITHSTHTGEIFAGIVFGAIALVFIATTLPRRGQVATDADRAVDATVMTAEEV